MRKVILKMKEENYYQIIKNESEGKIKKMSLLKKCFFYKILIK